MMMKWISMAGIRTIRKSKQYPRIMMKTCCLITITQRTKYTNNKLQKISSIMFLYTTRIRRC